MLSTPKKFIARFSLLDLQAEEIYLKDYGVYYAKIEPATARRKLSGGSGGGNALSFSSSLMRQSREANATRHSGRLKLCSKSLVFEPESEDVPLVRFPFDSVLRIGAISNDASEILKHDDSTSFSIISKMCIKMKAKNRNDPYTIDRAESQYAFALKLGGAEALSGLIQQIKMLLAVARLPYTEQQSQLNALLEARLRAVHFDPSLMDDFAETQCFGDTPCKLVTPLCHEYGIVRVTDRALYFQPMTNITAQLVHKVLLRDITSIVQRRHQLRHCGVEIYSSPCSSSSAAAAATATAAPPTSPAAAPPQPQQCTFLAFESRAVRDELCARLAGETAVPRAALPVDAHNMTLRWQSGLLTNFDYLNYLNHAAGRTANDLTQYPVMPWVLADYRSERLDLTDPKCFRDLSKPIGALNPTRLAAFKERYSHFTDEDEKFLYGTHYSSPGYVLFYVVRSKPELMLRLQNGKFDSADRLFASVAETYDNCLQSPTDVKELIPEFYDTSAGDAAGAFLVNAQNLDLGTRQSDKQRVHHVELPPWASSPRDFVAKMRAALECERVSERLHHWIDLIFGYKQRGEEAVKADNLFHPLTYEGTIDIDAIDDPQRRRALEAQIAEFGQCPLQLFTTPHPSKLSNPTEKDLAVKRMNEMNTEKTFDGVNNGNSANVTPLSVKEKSLEDDMFEQLILGGGGGGGGGGDDGGGGGTNVDINNNNDDNKANPKEISEISDNILATGTTASPNTTKATPIFDYATLELRSATRLHKDAINDMIVRGGAGGSGGGEEMLYSVSADGTLRLYSLAQARQARSFSISPMALSGVAAVRGAPHAALCSSWDNNLYIYSVEFGRVLDTLPVHDDAVASMCSRGDTVVTGGWDTTVRGWRVRPSGLDRAPLVDYVDLDDEVRCVTASANVGSGGGGEQLIVAGVADGSVALIDMRARRVARVLQPHIEAVSAVAVLDDGRRIATCSRDAHFKLLDTGGGEIYGARLDQPLNTLSVIDNNHSVIIGGDSNFLSVLSLQDGSVTHSFDMLGGGCVEGVSDGDDVTHVLWHARAAGGSGGGDEEVDADSSGGGGSGEGGGDAIKQSLITGMRSGSVCFFH